MLRAAWRGCAIGGRFLQAAELLEDSGFFAAAIVCHYTASFHLLEGYLALHGRVFLDDPHGQPKIEHREGATLGTYVPLDRGRLSLLATMDRTPGASS